MHSLLRVTCVERVELEALEVSLQPHIGFGEPVLRLHAPSISDHAFSHLLSLLLFSFHLEDRQGGTRAKQVKAKFDLW